MKYWDASALVPLLFAEKTTTRAREILREDPSIVTWGWTRVEIVGAVERRARERVLTSTERRDALAHVSTFADAWDEVTDVLAVRNKAIPLLARHTLRAADAAQLAAALLVADEVRNLTFVCFDERLADAAEREGLRVANS